MRKIAIIGGGLAGLIASIQLIRAGNPCTVYEKKSYPLHRVCGEYVSNEALPFLTSSKLFPHEISVPRISSLLVSSVEGNSCKLSLDLGGFGVSRYAFDHHLHNLAVREGVDFLLNTEVRELNFANDEFSCVGSFGTTRADVVIGAFGKRSRLDLQQRRAFIRRRSPWVGVKYHVRLEHPEDVIGLHNFPGGYCGVCPIENGMTNLCYLTHRDNLRRWGDLKTMERQVLFQNPHLRRIFSDATFLFDRAEVINEVSFAEKRPVDNHILMAGDAAGMIAPFCGNGMAMAIHAGKVVAAAVNAYCLGRSTRAQMEDEYRRQWNALFRKRLRLGRRLQHLFGKAMPSSLLVALGRSSPMMASHIIRHTHGKPFV